MRTGETVDPPAALTADVHSRGIVNIPRVISRASTTRRNSPGITYYMICAGVS